MIGSLVESDLLEKAHFSIEGGYQLDGEVQISGAKNSALVLMAASLLAEGVCRLRNVPRLVDVDVMSEILRTLGVKLYWEDPHSLIIDARYLTTNNAPYELVSRLRASFFAIGSLLSRLGTVRMPLPGGDPIGLRPVDLHLRGLAALGAEVYMEHGVVVAQARKLQGTKIFLDYPSVGATETLMMAATTAEGETVIQNAAKEPEIVDLANFCRAMGARIQGDGTHVIVISGVPKLFSAEYEVLPDRIEAGTFLAAAAITRSTLKVAPVFPMHLEAVTAKLRAIGTCIMTGSNWILLSPGQVLRSVDIQTSPFPGFPTDMQAQFMAVMTLSEGSAIISETVFENRFMHVSELKRLGANIQVISHRAIVHGVPFLLGASVTASDIRASASLVIAGLAADGITTISNLEHLDRGYETLEVKLQKIGARIKRVLPPHSPFN